MYPLRLDSAPDLGSGKKSGYTGAMDNVSHLAMPTATSSEVGSWDTVTSHPWETAWNPATATTPSQGQQMPLIPSTSTGPNSKRRTADHPKDVMDDEMDEETAEEIKKLELRLALLKDKARTRSGK